MKIAIDNQNKAIIATGYRNGKKIKTVCLCSDADEFNVMFGSALAKKRWRAKETKTRIQEVNHDIRYVENILRDLQHRKEILVEKYNRQEREAYEFCEKYFNE